MLQANRAISSDYMQLCLVTMVQLSAAFSEFVVLCIGRAVLFAQHCWLNCQVYAMTNKHRLIVAIKKH